MRADLAAGDPVYVVDDSPVKGLNIGRRLRTLGISNQVFTPVQHFLDVAHLLPVGSIVIDSTRSGESAQVRNRIGRAGMPIICLASDADGNAKLEPDELIGDKGSDEGVLRLQAARERISALSRRERQVLHLLVAGQSSKEIAANLAISPRTVETHRSRLISHLNVRGTVQAIKIAVEAGLQNEE